MAFPAESQRSFRLYVTHVDGEGHFLKISGQLDQQTSLMIEAMFESARDNLDIGIGTVPPATIHEGTICAVKYKDGMYYRAKIIDTMHLSAGLIGVHFIDYGSKDIISLSAIRFLDIYDTMFLQLRGQATDYYLTRFMHPTGRWDQLLLLKLQSLLCYGDFPAAIEGQTHTLPIISLQYQGNDFTTHLVSNRLGIAVPVAKQEVMVMQPAKSERPEPKWAPSWLPDSSLYDEHVPIQVNRNFPSNPASAMSFHSASVPLNDAVVSTPSKISQRLLVNNKALRGPVNLTSPLRQPQVALNSPPVRAATQPPVAPLQQPATYKSRLVEVNSQVQVAMSFAEEGPELFAVHLVTEARELRHMTKDLNMMPLSSLTETPMIGTICLGRMPEDKIICRAIVMDVSGLQCKLFFVDFGDIEMVSYYDIFDIPEEFVKPNVFAMRFCLSGVKRLEKGPCLNKAFKQLVTGKVMALRVVPPEGPPLIQYAELYIDKENVLDLLLAKVKDKLQFTWMERLPVGTRASVQVSYVDSCVKFYVQLSDKSSDLTAVMEAVKTHCEGTSSPGELTAGAACCARFPGDGEWYRAKVLESNNKGILVAYVDYGNEQEVDVSDLRTITSELIQLPAQALKCALKGFENSPVDSDTSDVLETLVLEKTLTANVMGVVSSDTMLVSLADDTTVPPLDVAREIVEPRPTTPVSEAPENNFKEEQRRDDDFGQRGGSFQISVKRDDYEEKSDDWNSAQRYRTQDRGERKDWSQRREFQGKDNRGGRGDTFTQVQELTDPAPLETPFPSLHIQGAHKVSIAWMISPNSLFVQLVSLQPRFRETMHRIPELYRGVRSYSGAIAVGASVLARCPSDRVLYRATVVAVRPRSKYVVQYVDFGNKELVDAKDIWQLDRQLLEVPRMAIHCAVIGVRPIDGEWKATPGMDLCFNAPRYQCVFQYVVDERHMVHLFNDGVSVADVLVKKKLALPADARAHVAVKEEAIDLAILVGQQIPCRVTRVESHEKFYVQLDLEKAELAETADANCDVTLPATLPAELSVHQRRPLECCLHNYTAESKVLVPLQELKTKLTGNDVIVYVDIVDGSRLMTTLYDIRTGQKLAIFEPDEGAFDEVATVCARTVYNFNFGSCSVQHVQSLDEVYLQKVADEDRVQALLDMLYDFYEHGTPEPLTEFAPEAYCAAKSFDRNWYRACVVSSAGGDVTVQLIDFGDTETVASDVVRTLDARFCQPCAQALVASLGLVALNDDAIIKLTEWTTEREVQVTLALGVDGWLASLHLDGVDLSMKLVDEKLATTPVMPVGETVETVEPVSLPSSHIDSHKPADEVEKIEETQAELQRETGALCVAKHSARKQVLDLDSDVTTVRDYGDTDALGPGQLKVIRRLPEEMPAIEPAECCSPANADGSNDARNGLDKLMDNVSTSLLVVELDTKLEVEDQFEDALDPDSSDLDLDGSLDSTHTVIENKTFEANPDSLNNSWDHNEKRDSSYFGSPQPAM